MRIRIGNGYDVHRLAPSLPLVLGGVKIEYTKGCVAHSDGDVIIHALCDALFGALSMGDIGRYFPDTEAEFAGIESTILLRRTYEMVLRKGYRLINADITLLLQEPKIAPYVEQMRRVMGCIVEECEEGLHFKESGADRISVKATTTEKLGFIGREEGVASYVSVLVEEFSPLPIG